MNHSIIHKGHNAVSKIIRKAAEGQECKLGIPGVCCRDATHTIGCHLRMFGFAGTGQKPDDLFIIDACDNCHFILDHRDMWSEVGLEWMEVMMALMLTQRSRREAGLISISGEE